MNPFKVIVLGMAFCAGETAFAEQKQAAPMWNDEAAKAARAVVEQGLAAVERLDAQALRGMSTPDLIAYDIDLESKPLRMGSQNEAVAYIEAISAEVKKMGAKVKFENTRYNCRAMSDLAYCLLEYDFVSMMADGTRMVQPSQTTVVLTRGDGGWKWAHWHTSLSAAPTSTGAK